LAEQAKKPKSSGLLSSLTVLDRLLSGTKANAPIPRATALGATAQSQIAAGRLSAVVQEAGSSGGLKSNGDDDGQLLEVPQDAQAAFRETEAAKDGLRRLNGRRN
jgi:hypothetical protein